MIGTKQKAGYRGGAALYIMLLPAFILVAIYHYGPLFGLTIAFQRYNIARSIFNQKWTGWDNFNYIFDYPNFFRIVWNTFFISVMKFVGGMIVPIIVSLLLNELQRYRLKRILQTTIYLPHFISWVIISGIFIDVLSPNNGIINYVIKAFGFKPIYFLGEPQLFPYVLVATDIWKNFGFGTIIYLAALTGINPNLYQAADIDGATRLQKVWHISIPGIAHIVVLIAILNLGHILNAGFEQVFNMYNPMVYSTGDIIDTLVYRLGIQDALYDLATAVGLFKSSISLVLVSFSYWMAYKFANYRIF